MFWFLPHRDWIFPAENKPINGGRRGAYKYPKNKRTYPQDYSERQDR
jgi:hypothetical protein